MGRMWGTGTIHKLVRSGVNCMVASVKASISTPIEIIRLGLVYLTTETHTPLKAKFT